MQHACECTEALANSWPPIKPGFRYSQPSTPVPASQYHMREASQEHNAMAGFSKSDSLAAMVVHATLRRVVGRTG